MALYRRRSEVVCVDSAHYLTRGSPVGLAAALAQLHPARGTFTGLVHGDADGDALFGQMVYTLGTRSAHLTFFTPQEAATVANLGELLEGLAWYAGDWGAYNLLGEIDEQSPLFEGLRRAGFSVYAWQRVWQMAPGTPDGGSQQMRWQPAAPTDEVAVRGLFHSLIPPLVQSAEPMLNGRIRGLVCRDGGEIVGYVEGIFGPRGIYLYPLIHPDIDDVAGLLRSMPGHLAPLLGRPVYLAVRSYQAWLEATLTALGARSGVRQALMVKHLTLAQRVPLNARLAPMEGRQAEPAKYSLQPSPASSRQKTEN